MKKTFLVLAGVLVFIMLLGYAENSCAKGREYQFLEHYNNGVELMKKKNYAEAEKEFDLANNINSRDWEAARNSPGDTSGDLEDQFVQRHCESLLNRGIAKYRQGKTEEAMDDLDMVVEQGDPGYYFTYVCSRAKADAEKVLEKISAEESKKGKKKSLRDILKDADK